MRSTAPRASRGAPPSLALVDFGTTPAAFELQIDTLSWRPSTTSADSPRKTRQNAGRRASRMATPTPAGRVR